MRPKRGIVRKIAIALLYLLAWEAASLLVGKELLLPSPQSTIARLLALLGQKESWLYAGLTLGRILAGFVLGVALGVLLAALTARRRPFEELLKPLRGVIKATPVTSFILLALLWLSSNLVPVFIGFLMVMPIVWTSTAEAITHTDARLLEMSRVFGLGKWQRLVKIYVPSVLPAFLAACTTSLGFAWKAGVAAEIIALPKQSIGYRLYESKLRIETVDLFAWTLLVILLSMLLEALLVYAARRIRRD